MNCWHRVTCTLVFLHAGTCDTQLLMKHSSWERKHFPLLWGVSQSTVWGTRHWQTMAEVMEKCWPILIWWLSSSGVTTVFASNATVDQSYKPPCQPGRVWDVPPRGLIWLPPKVPVLCTSCASQTQWNSVLCIMNDNNVCLSFVFRVKVTTVRKAMRLQSRVRGERLDQVSGPLMSVVVSAALHITLLTERVSLAADPADQTHNKLNLDRTDVSVRERVKSFRYASRLQPNYTVGRITTFLPLSCKELTYSIKRRIFILSGYLLYSCLFLTMAFTCMYTYLCTIDPCSAICSLQLGSSRFSLNVVGLRGLLSPVGL